MSSSVGYGYSFVDEAAAAARRARERLAQLEASAAAVTAQARQVGALRARRVAGIAAVRPRANASAAEIEAQADTLEADIRRIQAELGSALADHWSASLHRAVAKDQRAQQRQRTHPATPAPARPAATSTAAAAPAAPATANAVEQACELATAEVAGMLKELGTRCAAEDLGRIDALTRQLAEQSSVSAIRSLTHEIRVVSTSSVRRQESALRIETDRARLRALTEELPRAERERLNPLIDAAQDPSTLSAEVGLALVAADQRRRRNVVAKVTTETLRAMGCAVTDGFADELVDGENVLAPFPGSDYGLLVRFRARQDQIGAVVVRREDRSSTPERDLAAQQEFCASGLPKLTDAWTAAGLSPHADHRLEPGARPLAPYPAQTWIDLGVVADQAIVEQQQQNQAQTRARGGERA